MTTDIAKPQDFQTRMFERIKAQMGELMTDEELKKIVEAAVQQAFFSPSRVIENPGHYTERTISGPPHIVTLVKGLIEQQVKDCIQVWLAEHSVEVTEMLQNTLDGGIVKAVAGAFDRMTNDKFSVLQNSLYDTLRNMPR